MRPQIIITFFHACHLSATTLFIPLVRSPFHYLFWLYWSLVILSFLLYFLVSLSDPGFIIRKSPDSSKSHHHQGSIVSVLTSSSALNRLGHTSEINNNQKSNEISFNNIAEVLSGNHSSSVSINLDAIQDDVNKDNELRRCISSNNADESDEIKESEKIEIHAEEVEPVRESHQDNDYTFCTSCYIDQALRVRHCKRCGFCVAMYDHHCPYLNNCIGEKNKFSFFWFIFIQILECFLTTYLAFSSAQHTHSSKIWFELNYKYLLVAFIPCLLGLLLFILWTSHIYLACRNLTTFEMMRWKDIFYLQDLKISPFSQGMLKNLKYFCKPFKGITLWKVNK